MGSKKIMVIAGSKWQIPITKKIASMGHKPYVVNLYEDSPAFAYAAQSGVMDILDRAACLEFARRYKIDAVLSEECDIAMPTVAYVAEQLGLPSLGSASAALYTNKFSMREFCRQHGLAFPAYKKCKDLKDALCFYEEAGGPIIIKPLDSNSSRGVYMIRSAEELKLHFEASIAYSKVEKCVLAERYIEGTEFTIDGVKTPDRHYTLAISEKKHYAHNPNIACELYFSHGHPRFDYEKLREVNDRFVNASGLPFGLTHAEYKYENGTFYLIEIAARGGGNLISSDIVPLMSGADNYRYLINASLGQVEHTDFTVPKKFQNRCAVLRFFDTPRNGGMVSAIEGVDFLKTCENIDCFELYFKVGDLIEPAADDSKRIGFYIAHAESDGALRALMRQIDGRFQIHIK